MRRDSLRQYTIPGAILAAGALLRIWLILRHSVIQNDSNLYAEIATNWVHHGVYGFSTDAAPRPTLIRLPGYPMFLIACTALLGFLFGADSFVPALVGQLVLDLAGCVLLALTVRSIARRAGYAENVVRRASFLTLAAASLCPFTANYVSTPLTECPTNFTIALAFFAFETWLSRRAASRAKRIDWSLIVLGFALSWSLLLRPDQLILAAAFLFAMLWTSQTDTPVSITPLAHPSILKNALESRLRQRMRDLPRQFKPARGTLIPALIVAAITFLPLVPWTARNWNTFHVLQPLAPKSATDPGEAIPTGFQHWYRTWAVDFASTEEFYWKYPEDPLDAGTLPNRAFDSDAQFDGTVNLIADSNEADQYNRAIDDRFQQLANQRRAADPLRYYLFLPSARVADMLFHPRNEMWATDLRWWQYAKHPAQTIWATLAALLSAAYFAAGAWGLYQARRIAPRIALAALAYFLLRCAVLFMLDNAEQRYTVEFFPLAMLGLGLLVLPSPGISGAFDETSAK